MMKAGMKNNAMAAIEQRKNRVQSQRELRRLAGLSGGTGGSEEVLMN
jgi:hypothetical protein